MTADVQRAQDAEERGEGICRACLAPIWNEGGTVDHHKRDEGWSDRIERGGDSLVCFKAVGYRHVPLTGREAAIYDRAYARGIADAEKRAAAGALRDAADSSDLRMSYATRELLRIRAAALDPSGAAEGAGR